MKRRDKIIYWVATIWLSLGMLSTGIVQLLRTEEEVSMMTKLGYPVYVLTIIGVWKLLGVTALLLPKLPVIKEWAYAGFFIAMSGAIISHVIIGDEIKESFGPSLLIILTIVSWYYRPANRKVTLVNQ